MLLPPRGRRHGRRHPPGAAPVPKAASGSWVAAFDQKQRQHALVEPDIDSLATMPMPAPTEFHNLLESELQYQMDRFATPRRHASAERHEAEQSQRAMDLAGHLATESDYYQAQRLLRANAELRVELDTCQLELRHCAAENAVLQEEAERWRTCGLGGRVQLRGAGNEGQPPLCAAELTAAHLTTELDAAEKETSRQMHRNKLLFASKKELEGKNSQLQLQLHQLRSQHEEATNELEKNRAEQQRCRQSMTKIVAEKKINSDKVTEKLREDNRTLELRNKTLAEQLESRRKISEKSAAEVKRLKKVLTDTEQQLSRVRNSHSKLSKAQHEAHKQRASAVQELEIAEAALADAVAENDQLREAGKQTVTTLQAELHGKNEELQVLRDAAVRNEQERLELLAKLQQQRVEQDVAVAETDTDGQITANSLRAVIAKQRLEIDVVRAEGSNEQKRLEAELLDAERRIAKSTKALSKAAQDRVCSTLATRAPCPKKLGSKDALRLSSQLANAEGQIAKLRAAQTGLRKENKEMATTIKQMEVAAAATASKLAGLEGESSAAADKANARVLQMEKELASTKSKLASRDEAADRQRQMESFDVAARTRRADEMAAAARSIVEMLKSEVTDGPATFHGLVELFRDRPDPRPRLPTSHTIGGDEAAVTAVAVSRTAMSAVAEGRPALCKFEELLQCLAGVQSAARLISEHQALRAELAEANSVAAEVHEALQREMEAAAPVTGAESQLEPQARGWGLQVRRPGQLRPSVVWRSIVDHHQRRQGANLGEAGGDVLAAETGAGELDRLVHGWISADSAVGESSSIEAGVPSEMPSQLEVEQWVIPQLALLASGVPSAPLVEAGIWDMAGALRQQQSACNESDDVSSKTAKVDPNHPTMRLIALHYGAAAAAEVGRVHAEIFGLGFDNPDAGGASRLVWDEASGQRTRMAEVIRTMHRTLQSLAFRKFCANQLRTHSGAPRRRSSSSSSSGPLSSAN